MDYAIAGNLTILGAASNIIISDVAEARGLKSFTYFEFLKIGVLVTMYARYILAYV